MELLRQNIEALIFACETSITLDEIKSCLKSVYGWELTDEEVKSCIDAIREKYEDDEYSFGLNEIARGYRFLSKPAFYGAIQIFIAQKNKKRLSTAALETLSIIAYRQPISKAAIEQIRGVSCDYSIQKLLEKELIEIEGKSDLPGKPLVYATSKNFMDYFGLKDSADLPKLKDIILDENTIGIPAEAMLDIESATLSIAAENPENPSSEATLDAPASDDAGQEV
ncbi:MAG: SMC-Scp complex subunit ScpB [Bacteroidetes bacterium]|nr:SMC-Scp complex subunit ScpB [Bacteroidota bacterium]